MDKPIARPENTSLVEVEDGLYVPKNLLTPHTNTSGFEMLMYKYCQVLVESRIESTIYKIGEPTEAARILAAINSSEIRFVRIGSEYVNINDIRKVSPNKKGYCPLLEEKP